MIIRTNSLTPQYSPVRSEPSVENLILVFVALLVRVVSIFCPQYLWPVAQVPFEV